MQNNEVTSHARPWVDFYRLNGISPVSQDVSDFARHLARREGLYRTLGIPTNAVRGRSVVEFCPGSGFNALYTLALQPERLLLVDGNPVGLATARSLFESHFPDARAYEICESFVEDFSTSERFDLVLCEGAIPMQLDPPRFALRVAEFAAPGGVVVVTTIDEASFLSEIIRRLIGAKLSDPRDSITNRLAVLRSVFAVDLQTLRFRSRPVDDWIVDNIIQPFTPTSRYFSIADAITTLGSAGFEVYGTSPAFVRDWRWYKELVASEREWNARAIEQYERNILTLLDYRYERPEHDAALGRALLAASRTIWQQTVEYEAGNGDALIAATTGIADVAGTITSQAPQTAAALRAAVAYLRGAADKIERLDAFRPFFGRGQQYVSFTRTGVVETFPADCRAQASHEAKESEHTYRLTSY